VYTGSKPQILHGIGEKGGGPIYKQAPAKTGPQGGTASPANCEILLNLLLNNLSLNFIIQGWISDSASTNSAEAEGVDAAKKPPYPPYLMLFVTWKFGTRKDE